MVQNIQLTGYSPKIARVNNLVIGFTEEGARRLHHPHNDLLIGFRGTQVYPLGVVTLPVTVGDYP